MGNGAFSVSESRRAAVIRTIQDQGQHHRRISFQEEFLKLLLNHGVEPDEPDIGRAVSVAMVLTPAEAG